MIETSENQSHVEIARLEQQLELLVSRRDNCRKVALAARAAIGAAIALFAASLVGIIHFGIEAVLTSLTAVIGGLVLLGSNSSTAQQIETEIADNEAARAELFGTIRLRVVGGSHALH